MFRKNNGLKLKLQTNYGRSTCKLLLLLGLRVLFIISCACVLQTPIPDAGFRCTEPGHLLPHRNPPTPGLDVSTPHRPLQQIQLRVST